ncbi:MAG: ATP-binding cassette domain-containing protein [Clostridia bacterium]|nr:ATP-binding cassette domain-containing protein [Clostridia bacterium]
MVEVKNLVKSYGNIDAVKNISFTANVGEVLGFLGPNGAGKSTTMNIIAGYLSATSGTVTIDGYDIVDDAIEAKKRIGYLPELPPVYQDMTVKKYLNFMYELKKVTLPREEHLAEIMKLCGIDAIADRVIRNLSKGYRQRVGVAQALVGNPPVIILDEPTVGLDPKQIIEMRALIKNLGKKHAVIFSSHVLSEVSAVCDRIVVISQGQIAADEATDKIAYMKSNEMRLLLTVEGNSASVISAISAVDGVTKVRRGDRQSDEICDYSVEYKKDTDIRRGVFRALAKAGCPILQMRDAGMSLEEMFLTLTTPTYQDKGGKN